MYCSVGSELSRVRRMAELTDEPFLLYLIDVAIIEADALSVNESLEALDFASAEGGDRGLERAGGGLAH